MKRDETVYCMKNRINWEFLAAGHCGHLRSRAGGVENNHKQGSLRRIDFSKVNETLFSRGNWTEVKVCSL